jgi:hypothetical protein
VVQLEGAQLRACQTDLADEIYDGDDRVSGWCYVDATSAPPIGSTDLVASCSSTTKHDLRFVGAAEMPPGAARVIVCQVDECAD